MTNSQPGILAPIPDDARYLSFSLIPGSEPIEALEALAELVIDDSIVVGLGSSLLLALGRELPGMRTFPALVGAGIDVPSTPVALWCWLRGDDRGELVHCTRAICEAVETAFLLDDVIDGFKHGSGLDLSGYEDGTENPEDEAAVAAGLIAGAGAGLDGGSFVAVQQWVHDLDTFMAMEPEQRDNVIGRRISDNEELDTAPDSAHVKRTAQEDFEPEAFILRRSMPWADAAREGLVFVAFGKSFDAYEMLMKHMLGHDDGIHDELFSFTRPVTGAYFFCPPVKDGRLDLSSLSD